MKVIVRFIAPLFAALALVLSPTFVSCSSGDDNPPDKPPVVDNNKVTRMTGSPTDVDSAMNGEAVTLSATPYDNYGAMKGKLVWSTTDTSVATVVGNGGDDWTATVTPKNAGTATITATAADDGGAKWRSVITVWPEGQRVAVYVGGTIDGKAVVWKNGTPLALSDKNSRVVSVIATNRKYPHMAGYDPGETGATEEGKVVWMQSGAELGRLKDAAGTAPAQGTVNAIGYNIYGAAKLQGDNYQKARAAYWQTGGINEWKAQTLPSDGESAINAIHTSGLFNDVMCGFDTPVGTQTKVACTWTHTSGGIRTNLSTTESDATSVFYWDENPNHPALKTILVGGHETVGGTRRAVLWRNGEKEQLGTAESAVTGIAAKGTSYVLDPALTDIYAVGWEKVGNETKPILWHNGERQELSSSRPNTVAHSVALLDGDVYICGHDESATGGRAVLWKNGVRQELPLGGGAASTAVSVSVTLQR
jgi:hypothetical protein